MLYEVTGNIVTDDYHWKIQQVNCKGVMGARLALQFRNRFPGIYWDYKKALDYEKATLGHIVVSGTHETVVNSPEVISMFSQDGYGRDKRYTDYDAFKKCLEVTANHINDWSHSYHPDWKIAIPYGIGCGLAGGDWNVIYPMIVDFASKVKWDVYIIKWRR